MPGGVLSTRGKLSDSGGKEEGPGSLHTSLLAAKQFVRWGHLVLGLSPTTGDQKSTEMKVWELQNPKLSEPGNRKGSRSICSFLNDDSFFQNIQAGKLRSQAGLDSKPAACSLWGSFLK